LTNDDLIEAMVGHRVSDPIKRAMPATRTVSAHVRGLQPNGNHHQHGIRHREGEIVGLAGLEGNGQKEILLAVGGALRHRGEIIVGGKRHTARSPADAIAQGVPWSPLIGSRRVAHCLVDQDNITLSCLQQFVFQDAHHRREGGGSAAGAAAARLQLRRRVSGLPSRVCPAATSSGWCWRGRC